MDAPDARACAARRPLGGRALELDERDLCGRGDLRLQLFPDVGAKLLDLSVAPDAIVARFRADGSSVTAEDGEDGLDKVAEVRPDLITLDVTMPTRQSRGTSERFGW